jgi:23S rRNA G2069 N7-methylase RlmK/C1962 C5-methylase RlmI
MDDVLDIERDHGYLIKNCLKRLLPGGTLYFSTNKRRFRLDEEFQQDAKDITKWTVPPDFTDTGIHKAWEFHWK